jgi:hypothetical protein
MRNFMSILRMHSSIEIRPVQPSDIDTIVLLEKEVWSRLGAPILTRAEISSWYEDKSPFFLIAEHNGMPCGYYFGKIISFGSETVLEFLNPDAMTGKGFSRHTHAALGNCLYGISMVSRVRGSGRALYTCVHELLETIGITRLSGLNEYVQTLYAQNTISALPPINVIAKWYLEENARLLGRTSPFLMVSGDVQLPSVALPDPVLAFHVMDTRFLIHGLIPNYIVPDPESLNYGALILSEYPHR